MRAEPEGVAEWRVQVGLALFTTLFCSQHTNTQIDDSRFVHVTTKMTPGSDDNPRCRGARFWQPAAA